MKSEIQDTAPRQWDMIRGLTAEYFAGDGAREGERTLFIVGDEKQSIYSFQGAEPARFIAEGFVDRGYTPARRLVPRSQPGALLASDTDRAAQAIAIATGEPITANDGSLIHVMAQSLCIHSDSPGAEQTALRIAGEMAVLGITIKAPGELPDEPVDLLRR